MIGRISIGNWLVEYRTGYSQLIKNNGMDSLISRRTIAVVLKQIKSHFELNSTDEKFYEYLMEKFQVSNK